MSGTAAISALSPAQAWTPIERVEWTPGCAQHLLRRAGFSATPAAVRQALDDGLYGTLDRLFGKIELMPEPASIASFRQELTDYRKRVRTLEGEELRRAQAEFRLRQQNTYANYGVEWLRFAANPHRSAAEKWVAFLQNTLVVSYNKVRSPNMLFDYQQTLRQHALDPYPELVTAVSRSPAMMQYLDLQQNTATRPNENFARELFELFVLGEGNYTERDIKEASRAFTGYRQRDGNFVIVRSLHDPGIKTIFGQSEAWNGDDVIRLAFAQPAAATHLPARMLCHYLCEEPLPAPYLNELGVRWAAQNFNLQWLIRTVFSSRIFYHPAFRGTLIKAPNHFLIGLMQDLLIHVRPFNSTLNHLRAMGQPFFAPPNVRGWVGGKQWINSSTIAARRQLVQQCFEPIAERRLNADDKQALDQARKNGETAFHIDREKIEAISDVPASDLSLHLINSFLPLMPSPDFQSSLETFIGHSGAASPDKLKAVIVALLQSPYYHLS